MGEQSGGRSLTEQILQRGRQMQDTAARAAAMQPLAARGQPSSVFLELPPARVRHYASTGRAGLAPVLIVYSMINRPYLLDLQPRRSVVRHLTRAGADVYVMEWGDASALDRDLDMAECIGDFLPAAVSAVRAAHGGEPVNLMGVCQGGTMAVCHAALQPHSIRTLATFATPVDFHTPGNTLGRLVRDIEADNLATLPGNIPSALLNTVFVGLKPLRLLDQRYFAMPELCADDESLADFLRMERWMYDSPNQPTAAVQTFVRDFYQRNALVQGSLRIRGRTVNPAAIDAPLFNAYALEDHLIPPESARALDSRVGSAVVRSEALPGGHLGLFVGGQAHRELYPAYAEWLGRHGGLRAGKNATNQ